jgi:mannose/cellobiose epimerase-like protein (N-acyl-D-glucosamine 2-epimerase family)
MRPAPAELVEALRVSGRLSNVEAEAALHAPVAEDICVEADSAGHTDRGVALVLAPVIQDLRDQIVSTYAAVPSIRVGMAGGLGTPRAIAAAFALGVDFIATKARTPEGGWVRTLDVDGSVLDATEDAYDHACVLLALAHAHRAGNKDAEGLGRTTFDFLDERLEDRNMRGFLETSQGEGLRRTNPHMHLLEAFLAWYHATGNRQYLRRASRVIDLFRSHFFDAESWTIGEYFDDTWKPAAGEKGQWTEPGHHFEWAALLVEFSRASGQNDLVGYARKLYASAIANGLNRATGLAYGAVSREGIPLERTSRSWPQTEAIKAAMALDETGGPDMKPEIEARVGRLFRWHIDPAPSGLWIDQIDERGRALAKEAPASILYHIVTAFSMYLTRYGEASPK